MSKIQIFVEGKCDRKFIKQYIEFLAIDSSNIIYEETGGWQKIRAQVLINRMLENTNKDGVNLIIFDADNNISNRKKEILDFLSSNKLTSELFLFPDNVSTGELESLLISLSNPSHAIIFNCFQQYVNCLQNASYTYKLPDDKDRFFAYVQANNGKTNCDHIDFLNAGLWNLNSANLNPLKTFLQKNL